MRELSNCLCCETPMPPAFLDLGAQPLANSYHDGREPLPRYPLAVAQCPACTHRQLTVAVDPNALFRDYLYVSGTTCTLRQYFERFAKRAMREAASDKVRVLDIGCNDGSLLEHFLPHAVSLHGIDPAKNLAQVARGKGLTVTTGFWSHSFARAWVPRHDIIIAMNVVGHVANPLDFLRGCKRVLLPGGRVYVQTSQCDWVENGEFDCVYHEHLSYFTESSFRALATRAGLHVEKVEKVPVHGRSWLFTLTDPLAKFTHDVQHIREWTRCKVEEARKEGYAVAGYGAAAKGNTFLNYAGIALDYIVDDNPLKAGLFTPGTDIPIRPPEALAEESRPLALILLAWNFEEEIVRKARALRPDLTTRFLRYFPTPEAFE